VAARGETQADVEVSTLVVPAWRLRWRAPELALVLGERALALASARHDEADRLRAESLVVFAGNRMGRGVRIADRAIDALKAAEAAGEHETAWLLRVELAACARSVGAPLTGFAAVTPVLEAPDVPAELRASALVQASECLVTVGRGDEPTRALAEADQLYVADTTLDDDTRLLLRGLIRAVQAAQHRRWGDIAAAIGAAREGLDLLGRFTDPSADSGQGIGRLTLELVLSLMDASRLLDASEVGAPLLDRPVRAPSASTTGWLRLALATRVHLPAGRVALAREMLRDAAASAERHQLDTLLAESLLALAHVHEVSGELADALTNLRSAHAAERRRARAVYAVRARLAAEFSGVHRQPADLHQQLASLLRPVEGMQVVTDGVLSAALKQQLRQWRPVQVRKGDGLKVKRVRRAAEDMTVEGLSAARQHAADRWRMVQPFGEPDDKTPEPLEPPPPPQPSSDRTVPASGLIASAGAMVSGRRRAARVAAGEIDEEQPATAAAEPPTAPEPQLTPDQERKRKVEQQLMELQREARRQIEAERQARAEQRAQAEREAAEEAARQAAAREEAAREEAARQAFARQEAARQAAAREEAARQEAARQAAEREAAEREAAAREVAVREASAREEASRSQPESVLDMLKAQGLRAGGRRRAPDAEAPADSPSWRVEPPSRLRQDDIPQSPASQSYYAGADQESPNYFADPSTGERATRPGLSAAFNRAPAAPDFGPHLDDPAPAYPLYTPAGGFPAAPADPDERKLPDGDYSSVDFNASRWSAASVPAPPTPAEHPDPKPEPDPEHRPLPPIPDPIPPMPTPDEIPQPPEPDLLSSTFLSSADVEPEDDISNLPTTPVRVNPAHDQPGFGTGTGTGTGTQQGFGTQTGFGTQPSFGTQTSFGTQANFGTQPTFGAQAGFGTQPDLSTPVGPVSDTGFGQSATSPPDQESKPDPAGWANFEIGPDFDVDPIVRMSTGPTADPATRPDYAEPPDPGTSSQPSGSSAGAEFGSGGVVEFGSAMFSDSGTGAGFGSAASSGSGTDSRFGEDVSAGSGAATPADTSVGPDSAASATQPASTPQYDFFATEPEQAAQQDSAQLGVTETAGTGQPSAAEDEAGARTGRPSSRRKPSDLSLADLLAEALVAYETGRRSDEQQFQAADLAVPEWSGAPDQNAEAPRPESTDSVFGSGSEPGADSLFPAGESFGSPTRAPEFPPMPSSPREPAPAARPADSYFLAEQPSATPPGPETPEEKTGPIVPVGAPDSETTGPIRPVTGDGPPGWTLPGV
jgi:hypothetical protein